MIQVSELTADYTSFFSEDEYQEYLRYDGTDQSNILPVMIEAAIRQAEGLTNATFGSKTYQVLAEGCVGKRLWLPFAPIIAVTAVVKVTEATGTETTITSGFTTLGLSRKYMTFNTDGLYKISYSAGYADPADVNPLVREAVLQILSENWERRDELADGGQMVVPSHVRAKLSTFRNNVL